MVVILTRIGNKSQSHLPAVKAGLTRLQTLLDHHSQKLRSQFSAIYLSHTLRRNVFTRIQLQFSHSELTQIIDMYLAKRLLTLVHNFGDTGCYLILNSHQEPL